MKEKKQRTTLQNRALHKYFSNIAKELNNRGMDMRKTLKPEIEIEWTGENVKEYLWRPVQEAQLGKISTTELSTTDIDKVFNIINRHFITKFNLQVNFPSIESIIAEMREKNL